LKNNYDLRIATLRIDEAEAALRTARLSYYPSFSFAPSGTLSFGDNFHSVSGSYKLPINISWELDLAGRLFNKKNKAKVAYEQSLINRRSVQTRLVASIANHYYTLLMLDSQLAISRTTAANWKENVRITRAMMDAGMTNKASVSQTEANSYSIEASLFDLERQIREVENALSLVLGIAPRAIVRGTLDEQSTRADFSVGVPAQLLANRPDVRGAELDLAKAHYTTNLARAAFYPNLTLSGAIGWTTGMGGSVVLDPGSLIANLLAGLTQPVFGRGVNKARLQAAQAQYEQAGYLFRQSLLDAGVEVNNALTMWQTAQKRVELGKKQIVSLQAAVWNTQLLMKHGNADYLEVLTAQKNLLQAELTEASDRLDEIKSVINLYRALGGGY
jgi:NodT family efflux transporter outer membrane factor (OMF) lipoprotein